MPRIFDYLLTLPQYVLPQHGLTSIVYRLTRIRVRWLKNLMINSFIKLFKVNMGEAETPHADDYQSFNAFFTRHLQDGARPMQLAEAKLLSPVDGAISQLGNINNDRLIQAKGKDYSLEQLLAGDDELVKLFKQGEFATLYLSPRDYHRIHMPFSGQLDQTIYVPGKLFAVNNPAVRTVDGLFARNERYISIFDTAMGKVAVIMVGALFVGSMETVWAGQITPSKHRQLAVQSYGPDEVVLKQGDELGQFNMGSTIILLFEKNRMQWRAQLQAGDKIQLGQELGLFTTS